MRARLPLLLIALLSGPARAAEDVPGLAPIWIVETPKDAPAVLTYGPPTTPQLGFSCVRKSGQIATLARVERRLADHQVGKVWVDAAGVAAPWPVSVTFASAADRSILRGEAGAGEAGTEISTEISTAAPVMKSFAKTGTITLTVLSETLSPLRAKPGQVRKFLGACR
jgi:hypothetical protein